MYEARLMGQVAREMKVATQMGNQGTASPELRRAAAWLRAGVLGTVQRSARLDKPAHLAARCSATGTGRVPEARPLGRVDRSGADASVRQRFYHDFKWRGWWDFGTGALGDMACHEINMAFMGLDLRHPASFQAQTSGHNHDSLPSKSIVTYEFPANGWRPAVKLVWYDGGNLPPAELLDGRKPGDSGQLVIGDKGKLWGDSDLVG